MMTSFAREAAMKNGEGRVFKQGELEGESFLSPHSTGPYWPSHSLSLFIFLFFLIGVVNSPVCPSLNGVKSFNYPSF